jgi:hypothetical protein
VCAAVEGVLILRVGESGGRLVSMVIVGIAYRLLVIVYINIVVFLTAML